MRIRSRAEWGGDALRATASQRKDSGFAVHWEGPHMGAYAESKVPGLIRGIEAFHRRNGWSDIAYNFIVDRFGGIWEGRGWWVRNGANGNSSANYNYRATCYLGGERDEFSPAAKVALAWLYHQHLALGGDPETQPHNYFTATACPGPDITGFVLDVLPYTSPVMEPAEEPEPEPIEEDEAMMKQFVDENGKIWGVHGTTKLHIQSWTDRDLLVARGVLDPNPVPLGNVWDLRNLKEVHPEPFDV